MPAFRFLHPPGPSMREGGAAYLANLQAALAAAGHTLPREAAPGVVTVIDGLFLPDADPALVPGATAIVHHPAALATGPEHDRVAAVEAERLPLLRRIVTTSTLVRDRLLHDHALDPARVVAIVPGVAEVPRTLPRPGPGVTILSLGALVPRKGHATLIGALQRLSDLPWRLVIAGDDTRDPAHTGELRALAAHGGDIGFAGPLHAAGLDEAWRAADLFALATTWEGYAAPVAEALRRGLPVAVTTGGDAAALVTPETGVTAQPGDIEQLSKALRRLIFDAGLRAEMADAAFRAGQSLPTWPQQAARFVEVTCC